MCKSTETESTSSKTYTGNCHCGAVRFTATLSPSLEDGYEVMDCNCSICQRNQYRFAYLPTSEVKFSQGKDELKEYRFGKKETGHYFCPTCSTSVYAENVAFAGYIALNVHCFSDIDFHKLDLKTKIFDGGAMEPRYKV